MKVSQNKQRNVKKIVLITSLVCIILLAIFIALELTHVTNFVKNPFYKPSAEQLKQQQIDTANKADQTTGSKQDITTNPNVDDSKSTSEVPIDSTGSVTITTLSQANGQVTYAASISDTLKDGGTCTIVFTNPNGKPVTRTTTAVSHSCGPQNIPETEFTVLGSWQATIRYFINNTQVVTSGSITIQ